MRTMLKNKLWEKVCDWKKDLSTDPTTYIALVQPNMVGLYLVVRTRYNGASVQSISYNEACNMIGDYYLQS
mgnify:CR=1 FL=1